MPPSRGGRANGRGGRGGGSNAPRSTVTIAGTEVDWDLAGLDIQKTPAERWPPAPRPRAPPPTPAEAEQVRFGIEYWERCREDPTYTVLGDGMPDGLKRKGNKLAPTETQLFNPFTDNQTYSSKYLKEQRREPDFSAVKFDRRFFHPELHSRLDYHEGKASRRSNGAPPNKRRRLSVTKASAVSKLDRLIQSAQNRINEAEARGEDELEEGDEAEEEVDTDKPDAVNEDDNWSAASSDSEDSDDDYNAERYYDNGEGDDIDDGDPDENTYD